MISRNSLVQFTARSFIAIGAVIAVTATAAAQDAAQPAAPAAPAAPQSAESPWLKICNTNPETNAEICIVRQELLAETGRPIAVLTIQQAREAGKYGVGIVVPVGFILPPGISLVVDGTKTGTAQYTICTPPTQQSLPVCLAQAPVDESFINALKAGNKLQLVVVNPQNRQIPIEMSLAGFSKTFDGPGIDRAAAEAQRKQLSDALQKSAEEARKKLIEQQQKELGNAPQ